MSSPAELDTRPQRAARRPGAASAGRLGDESNGDNRPLPPRRRLEREAPELGAAVDRMLLALVRRGAGGELEAIEELVRIRAGMPALVQAAVAAAVVGPGDYSFGEVGRWLGISRQAARQMARRARARAARG